MPGGGLGQVRLEPGKRSPESLRHKHLLLSLSRIDVDGFRRNTHIWCIWWERRLCIFSIMLALGVGLCFSMPELTWSASSSAWGELCCGAALFQVFPGLFRCEVDHHCEPISKEHAFVLHCCGKSLKLLWDPSGKNDCNYSPFQFP